MSLMWDLHDGNVSFAPHLIGSGDDPPGGMTAKDRLLEQFGQVHKKFRPNGSWVFTGKTGRGNSRDDLVMALILVHVCCRIPLCLSIYDVFTCLPGDVPLDPNSQPGDGTGSFVQVLI
jgi:hypothetical protein